jgi:hypothetical protein
MTASRAQSNLLALPVALVVLTVVTVGGVAVADTALDAVDASPRTDHAAATVADRLVAADAGTTVDANVLRQSRVATLSPAVLERLAPVVDGRAVRIRLDGRTLLERGDPEGRTVRRAVLVVDRRRVRREVVIASDDATVTVGPTPQVRLTVTTAPDGAVETVRAGDRVVLHDPEGVEGAATVRTRAGGNTTLRFAVDGTARITLVTTPRTTRPATLEVTVGDR